MIEIKPYLRRAYLEKLNNVVYEGVVIPFDDENLTKDPAYIVVGNSTPIEAYVLIQNQMVQDNSPKCSVNQNTQLQLDVVTRFPNGGGANTGNYAHADFISSEILQILFPFSPNKIDLHLENAQLWMGFLETSRHILEEHAEERVYRNVLILNHSIKQYAIST